MDNRGVIVVTGSSGTIGYPLCQRLSQNYDVVGFDQKGPPYPPRQVECVTIDLTSEESVVRAFQNVREKHGRRIASVVHLAAYYNFSGEPSPLYEKVTVQGTKRLLHALHDFEVEQFVFSSTMLVHAPSRPGHPITEDTPLEPKWAYPKSKVKTEALIRSERNGIPAVLLRMAGVYDDMSHSIPLSQQITRIFEKQLISHFFPGNPSHGQALMHLDDLLDALERIVEKRRELPQETTMLLGPPETMSYGELQRDIGILLYGKEWTTIRIPKLLAKLGAWMMGILPFVKPGFIKPWMIDIADDPYELNLSRAHALLGWEPKRTLKDDLPRIVAALKVDPPEWYRANGLEPPAWLTEATSKSTFVKQW